MTWFKREKSAIENPTPVDERRVRTEGLWIKCSGCRAAIWKKDLEANWEVCPKCDHHFRLSARRRLELLLDDAQWTEHDAELASSDPLHFTDTKPYSQRLAEAQEKLGMKDAILTVQGTTLRQARRLLLDGIWVHWRIDGRGSGREGGARHRTLHGGKAAADHCVLLGGRANDGGRGEPDAACESVVRTGSAG